MSNFFYSALLNGLNLLWVIADYPFVQTFFLAYVFYASDKIGIHQTYHFFQILLWRDVFLSVDFYFCCVIWQSLGF